MEKQSQDHKSLPTTSTTPSSSKGPRSSSELFQGSPEGVAARLQRPQEKQRPRLGDISPDAQKLMTGVFIRMKNIYGHLWSSNFPDDNTLRLAQVEWCVAFQGQQFTDRDIGLALDHCTANEPKMPNLPTFIGIACTERTKYRTRRHRARHGLPRIATETEIADQDEKRIEENLERGRLNQPHMDKIKAIFDD